MKLAATVEAPTACTPQIWVDVLTDFVGVRLAVYDELLRGGSLGVDQLAGRLGDPRLAPGLRRAAMQPGAIDNALGWLGAHRLAIREASGRWRHIGTETARQAYTAGGPDASHTFTLGGSLAAIERRGDRRESGALVGARAEAAEGVSFSTPRPPPVPRPTVFVSGLLDLGDY